MYIGWWYKVNEGGKVKRMIEMVGRGGTVGA